MKKIGFNLIVLFTFFATLVFTSCTDDDDYSLGKFVISLATVNPIDSQTGTYYLTMDDGTTLWPAASDVFYKPKADQRVWINFTLLSDSLSGYDHYIKINYLQDILTKNIVELTDENEEEIGNDPIKILDYWIGDNYLNIHFGYNTGGEKVHTINLVQNTLQSAEEAEAVVLEFRHNKNDDPERYGVKGYAAFDLRPFQAADKGAIDFIIKVKDFDNKEKEYKITYKYDQTEKYLMNNKTITSMPDNVKFN